MSDPGTREKILSAALDAFAADGFEGASTRQIANAAGVNQGLITYYFKSKENLWRESVAMAMEAFASASPAPTEGATDNETLRSFVRHLVYYTAKNPQLHRILINTGSTRNPRQAWLVEERIAPLFDLMSAGVMSSNPAFEGMHQRHVAMVCIGALTHLLAIAPVFEDLTGLDATSEAFLEQHVELLLRLFTDQRSGSSDGARG